MDKVQLTILFLFVPEVGPFFCALLVSSALSIEPSLSCPCLWRSRDVRVCLSRELFTSSRPPICCLSRDEAFRSPGLPTFPMLLGPWMRRPWHGGGSGGGGRSDTHTHNKKSRMVVQSHLSTKLKDNQKQHQNFQPKWTAILSLSGNENTSNNL